MTLPDVLRAMAEWCAYPTREPMDHQRWSLTLRDAARALDQAERERDEEDASHTRDVERYVAQVDGLVKQRDRAIAALRAVEWVEYTIGRWCCPWCGQHKSLGHESDCARHAALRETEG